MNRLSYNSRVVLTSLYNSFLVRSHLSTTSSSLSLLWLDRFVVGRTTTPSSCCIAAAIQQQSMQFDSGTYYYNFLSLITDTYTARKLTGFHQYNNNNIRFRTTIRYFATSSVLSPFDPDNQGKTLSSSSTTKKEKKKRRTFIPRIAAVQFTDKARKFFKLLLQDQIEKQPDVIGILLNYTQSTTGEPRMVYTFSFVTKNDIDIEQDEGVSLELITTTTTKEDGTTTTITIPKSPIDSRNDGLPKIYVHHNAFLKVLGATIDIDTTTYTPILLDAEGNRMDPNA